MEKLTRYLEDVIPEKLKLNELVPCRRYGWYYTPHLLPGELEVVETYRKIFRSFENILFS